jgi:uncharacterized phage protein gp47/JayE
MTITYGLTDQGLVIKSVQVIRAETEASLKLGFGPSVPLGDQTFFGITNGIYSEREAVIWELIELVHDSHDPDAATGSSLVGVSAITGTLPIAASSSTVTATLTGTPTTAVASGTVFAALSTGAQFKTTADTVIAILAAWVNTTGYVVGARVTNSARAYQCITAGTSAGSGGPATTALDITDGTVHWRYLGEGTGAVDVAAKSVATGPVVGVSGDLTVKITPVGGWQSVVNILDAKAGTNLETDEQLRLRREAELATDGSTPQDALRADLLQVDGVTSCTVFMNLTDITDANNTPPHGVQCVVQGGADQDIFDKIRLSIAAGIVSYGTTSGTSTDSQNTIHTIKFTRPTAVPIWVDITLKYNPALPGQGGYPADGDTEVIAAIVAYGNSLPVGSDAVATRLGAKAFSVPGVLDVPRAGSLGGTLIKTSAGPTADTTIVITPFQIATFDTSHVAVHSSAGSV